MAKKRTQKYPETSPVSSPAALLDKVAGFYHKALSDSRKASAFLKGKGFHDGALAESFRIGYCDGHLAEILPSSTDEKDNPRSVHDDLRDLGILREDGRELFLDCITFPITDVEGGIVGICGQDIRTGKERLPPSLPTRIWNSTALKVHHEIIMANL